MTIFCLPEIDIPNLNFPWYSSVKSAQYLLFFTVVSEFCHQEISVMSSDVTCLPGIQSHWLAPVIFNSWKLNMLLVSDITSIQPICTNSSILKLK